MITLRDLNIKTLERYPYKWKYRHSPCWSYDGQDACSWLWKTHQDVIDVVALHMWLAYPGSTDRAIHLADASWLNYRPDNPKHKYGHVVNYMGSGSQDFHYFTRGHINVTDHVGDDDYVQIWSNGELNTWFDIERNKEFLSLLHDCLPQAVIRVDSKIREALGLDFLSGDDNKEWRHGYHCHVDFMMDVNFDARVC